MNLYKSYLLPACNDFSIIIGLTYIHTYIIHIYKHTCTHTYIHTYLHHGAESLRSCFSSSQEISRFYGEEFLAPRPTLKLKDHPLSVVRDCLFSIFAAAFHIGGRSSNRNPRARHAVVTDTYHRNVVRITKFICLFLGILDRNCKYMIRPTV
jgi:hypothetical protein